MPPDVFLETDRLYLRRLTPEDAPLLYELHSDPEVMRYISKGEPMPLETIKSKMLPVWLAYYEEGDHVGYWAAHERATDAFMGWFHFRPNRDVPEDMELGYRLKREAWGQGYATEGSKALIDKAFTEWGVAHIIATTLEANKASQRVMEKCGLHFDKKFSYPGHRLPRWTADERRAVQYGLHRRDYIPIPDRPEHRPT